MTVRIQVLDRRDKPVENARVFVSWVSGGHSERRTNNTGVADLGVSAQTAERIDINGENVSGRIYLEDKVHQFSINKW